jgi:hypothetical protein
MPAWINEPTGIRVCARLRPAPGARHSAALGTAHSQPRSRFCEAAMKRSKTAFLFDLDGTLIDSVYQHVLAWKSSLDQEGIPLSVWRIHRKIGMSGGLFTNILLRETGFDNTPERLERLRGRHAEA